VTKVRPYRWIAPFAMCAAAAACADGDDKPALSADRFVASCIGIGPAKFEPAAVLCVANLEGNFNEVFDIPIQPGIRPALSADRRLIASREADRVVVRNIDGSPFRAIDNQADSLAWMPDSQSLVIKEADAHRASIAIVDTAHGTVLNELFSLDLADGELAQDIDVSSDGTEVAYSVRVGGESGCDHNRLSI
jgi:hypothetical protein